MWEEVGLSDSRLGLRRGWCKGQQGEGQMLTAVEAVTSMS